MMELGSVNVVFVAELLTDLVVRVWPFCCRIPTTPNPRLVEVEGPTCQEESKQLKFKLIKKFEIIAQFKN